jgi:hypothetical protein
MGHDGVFMETSTGTLTGILPNSSSSLYYISTKRLTQQLKVSAENCRLLHIEFILRCLLLHQIRPPLDLINTMTLDDHVSERIVIQNWREMGFMTCYGGICNR